MRRASASHWSSVSSALEVLANCSDSARTYRSMPGIEAMSSSDVSRPPARLEIVPPVAMSLTFGSGAATRRALTGLELKAWPERQKRCQRSQ